MDEKSSKKTKKKSKKDKKKKSKGEKKEKKNKKDLEKEEEEEIREESDSEDEDVGCWQSCGNCFTKIWMSFYYCIKSCCTFTKNCCGRMIYPCKERCCVCLTRVDHKLNPYKDAGYSDI